ncbi:kinase-like domain, phloem protein 2-like protein [Tanacetum coccineum]
MSLPSNEFAHLKVPLENILSATNNFAEENVISTGYFGKIYKGQLLWSGELIDITARRFNKERNDREHLFWMEISMLCTLKHKNLLSLDGFCDENDEKIIINRNVPARGMLIDYLSDSMMLTWVRRLEICVGVAHALSYIHYDEPHDFSVIHRYIDSSRVLLNDEWEPKLSDFGVSMKIKASQRHHSFHTTVKGVNGYLDPTYLETNRVSHKSDMYSFGIVLLEVLCGRTSIIDSDTNEYLAPLAATHYKEERLSEIIDWDLWKQMDSQSFNIFAETTFDCLSEERSQRPNIDEIVTRLEKALEHQNALLPLWSIVYIHCTVINMVISTRQTDTSVNTVNEELREMIREMINASMRGMQESISQLNQSIQDLAPAQEGFLVQQNYHTTDINSLKNGEGTSRPMHYTRMTKLEFPKFSGDDVKGWIFRQFVKIHGEIVEWSLYESEILKRFGACYEDPMEELKNLKQDGSVANYQDQFEVLLGKVEMFKPKTLYDAYHLARMQEASKAALAKRKEYEEKRATNLCFYCDQKYTPGHKCTGQVFSIELLTEEECLGEESVSYQDIVYNVEEDRIQPHISLNALAGITTYHTMRVKGRVGKISIHILFDSRSTHNFVDVNCAKRIGCRIKKTYPLQVDVPGGNKMISACECKDFIWSLQGMEFKTDAMLLPLGGCEMQSNPQRYQTTYIAMDDWKERSRKMACNVAELASLSLCVYPVSLVTAIAEEHEVPTTLPPHREQDHRIVLKEGTQPVNVRPYKHPPTQKNAIELMLNKHNVKDKFPMPVIEEFIDELHGAIIFNKLDLRIGKVAYKLQLPDHVKVHPVFHISKLKKCRSEAINMGTFPVWVDNGLLAVEPQAVLDMRMQKKNNKVTVYLLIRWVNGTKDDATWEPAKEFIKRFPNFSLDT